MTHPILVTGGTGTLGRRVVARLVDAGREVRVLSRRPHRDGDGVRYAIGDTVRGTGLAAAAHGSGTIVHLAGGARGDDRAAEHVASAARDAGTRHLVLISVVGADRMPIGYFRAKAAAEATVAQSGVPHTILRAAQFHDFILSTVGRMAGSPIRIRPGGLRFEPVDVDEVARRIVDLALDDPRGRVPDLAGPEILDVTEILHTLRPRARGPVLPLRIPGAVGRAYRAGENLAADTADRGVRTWRDFVAASAG